MDIELGITATAEAEIIHCADILAAIRAYAEDAINHPQHTCNPAKIIEMCEGKIR